MTPRLSKPWTPALALALTAAAWTATPREAAAASMTYSAVGTVDTPSGAVPGLIYYNGLNNATVPDAGTLPLGSFVMSSLAGSNAATYNQTPFNIVVYQDANTGEMINGVLNGTTGAGSSGVTATFTGMSQLGTGMLPFTMNVPLNTPLNLAMTDGTNSAMTSLMVPITAAAVPEPSSVAVFAAALGGLGLWSRRRRAAR